MAQQAELCVLGTLFAGSVVSNTLVLAVYYRKPNLRTFSNRFVLNLSVTHLLQTAVLMPATFVTVVARGWLLGGDLGCRLTAATTVGLGVASVHALLLIALDRNYAVNSPLHYTMTVTRKRTEGLIACSWAFSALVSLPVYAGVFEARYSADWGTCVVGWRRRDVLTVAYACFLSAVGFVFPLLKMAWVYGSMFQAARTNSARARKHSLEGCTHPTTRRRGVRSDARRRSSSTSQASIFGEEWKAIRTGLLVVCSFALCYLPQCLAMLLEAYCTWELVIPPYFMTFVRITSFSACVINPYLYVFRNKKTRDYVFRLLGCKKGRRQPSMFRHTRNERILRHAIRTSLKKPEYGGIEKISPIICQSSNGQWRILAAPSKVVVDQQADTTSIASDDAFEKEAIEVPSDIQIEIPTDPGDIIRNPLVSLNQGTWIYEDPSYSLSKELSRINSYRARFQRSSSGSDTFNTSSSSFDYQYPEDFPNWFSKFNQRKNSKSSTTGLIAEEDVPKPPLKRGKSFSGEERELNALPAVLSRFGGMRRSSFATSRLANQDSSESTLTSSTASSESQDLVRGRPRLTRQHSACCWDHATVPHP